MSRTRWPQRPVRLHVIKPQHPIPLDPAYYLGRIDAATLIDLGYQDACRYLDEPGARVGPLGTRRHAGCGRRSPAPRPG